MFKQLRNFAFCVALGLTSFSVSAVVVQAQQVDENQRAYQAGYQNGVNDAQRNRPMNMNTDDWHGDRYNVYQRGYKAGYDSVKGYGHEAYRATAPHYQGEDERAYQAGFQRGAEDAQHHHGMNMSTGDWHGDRLNIYQQGYQQGYHSVEGEPR